MLISSGVSRSRDSLIGRHPFCVRLRRDGHQRSVPTCSRVHGVAPVQTLGFERCTVSAQPTYTNNECMRILVRTYEKLVQLLVLHTSSSPRCLRIFVRRSCKTLHNAYYALELFLHTSNTERCIQTTEMSMPNHAPKPSPPEPPHPLAIL